MLCVLLPTQGIAQGGSNALHVFYPSNSGDLIHIYKTSAGWSYNDVTTLAGAPQPATQSAFTSLRGSSGVLHVYYASTDQHIHEVYWSSGTTWNKFDDSQAAGAPLVAVGSGLTSLQGSSGNIHVFYLGTDQHVHELIWTSGTTWTTFDDTKAASAPLAASGSALTCLQGSSGHIHVYYFGADQHVHELIWNGGTSWSTFDPTNAAGAPLAASGSTLTTYLNSSIYLYYIDTNRHLHQLKWTSGTIWTNTDLSSGLSQLAACGSGTASFQDAQGLQVFYLATNASCNSGGYYAQFDASFLAGRWVTSQLSNGIQEAYTSYPYAPVTGFTLGGVDHMYFVAAYPNDTFSYPLDIVQWDGNTGAGWTFTDLSHLTGAPSFDVSSFSSTNALTSIID
jgi:hypothetical protein